MPELLPNGNIVVPARVESEDGEIVGLMGREIRPDEEEYDRAVHFLTDPADRKRAAKLVAASRHKAA